MSVDAGLTPSNRAIFLAALEITDDGERHEFLARACGGDSQRLRKVERLLAALTRAAVPCK